MSAETTRSDFFFLLVVLLLAAAVRLIFLVATDFSIDSDEAIVGLMAKHLLEDGRWSIFYYGQPYMGSLEPTLTAVIFGITGISSAALKIVPTLFSLFLILAVYGLGRSIGGPLTGRFAALYLAIPPPAFLEWSTKARGGFIELVFLGTLVLMYTVRTLSQPREASPRNLLILGLVGGLAWWTNNQAIFYLAPSALILLLLLPPAVGWGRSAKLAAVGLLGFFAGSSPFWWFNFVENPRFQTFTMLGQSATLAESAEHFAKVFTESFPILVGARRFWSVEEIFPGSSWLAAGIWAGAVAVVFAMRCRRLAPGNSSAQSEGAISTRRVGLALILLFLVTTPLIFSLSAFGWLTSAPRYLLPLFSVLPLLVGLAAQSAYRILGSVGAVSVGVCFLGLNLVANYGTGAMYLPGEPFVFGRERVARDHRPLLKALRELGINHVRTNYWIGYRLAFESKESITFSVFGEPRQVRIPEYEKIDLLQSSIGAHPYLLSRTQSEHMTKELARSGYRYTTQIVGNYVLVDGIEPIVDNLVHLPIAKEQIEVSSRPEWAPFLVDGREDTRWGSGMPQHPGMEIIVRFNTPVLVAGLNLRSGLWPHDASKAITLKLRTAGDDSGWVVVYESAPGERLVVAQDDFVVYFDPRWATELKVEQNGSHPVFDWSVAELEVYSVAETQM